MQIRFAEPSLPAAGCVVVTALDERALSPSAAALDERLGGAIGRLAAAGRFRGRSGQMAELVAVEPYERVLLAGLGKGAEVTRLRAQDLGGTIVATLNAAGIAEATVMVDVPEGCDLTPADMAARAAFGAILRAYRFDKYRTREKDDQKPTLKSLTFMVARAKAAKAAYDPLARVADGVSFTRDLVSEPANILYPETLAKEAKALEDLGVKVEVLGEAEMKKLGMGALLGVGQGSARDSQLVVMQWQGGAKKDAPVAFVGKGVTFDTGGISIKPAAGMEDMKWDMGGAGVVVGLMKALAGRKAKVNAVGVVGLVENMPSGTAQRPGDIVTSMSKQTIEVLNTDAEGRLVLADALWYTQDKFKPKFMIDLATLTGAIIIALGSEHAGLFSNNDELAARLTEAGGKVGESVWRLPLGDGYDKQLASDAADMKNIGGREAGSITAAQFLQRFVNDVPWAHIDIAGVTWSKKGSATVPKGGTGFGVQLLNELVADYYEA